MFTMKHTIIMHSFVVLAIVFTSKQARESLKNPSDLTTAQVAELDLDVNTSKEFR